MSNPDKSLISHGLDKCEPLDYASIISGCFSNPNRKKYPDFLNEGGRIPISLYTEDDDPEYWVKVFDPELIKNFNKARIFLTVDTSNFYFPHADKEPFLEAIKAQSWHGPYKYDFGEDIFFVTINQSGDNTYFVRLKLTTDYPLRRRHKQFISLDFYKDYSWMADSISIHIPK